MPTAEQMRTDYDWFSLGYDETDRPLSLDEAISRAEALRSVDKKHLYRIVPVDRDHTFFRVEVVSQERVYADFLAKMSEWVGKRLTRLTAR